MARKTAVIQAIEGRDNGKLFTITEMPASQAEKWAFRAISALAKAGVNVPDHVSRMGLPGLTALGVSAICALPFSEAEPLMDEMFACIRIQPDADHPEMTRPLIESDIEEVATRVKLRKDWLTLHTGFSFPADSSN